MEKKAIYYFDKGRIYRPSKRELLLNKFICPVCKKPLFLTKRKIKVKVYFCQSCNFMIEHENILHNNQLITEYLSKLKNKVINNVLIETNNCNNDIIINENVCIVKE